AQCTRRGRVIRFLCTGTANEQEAVMKITSLIITFTLATALVALAQEGTVEEVKHGAKKAGQTVKDGVETAGKKTRETAERVGEKTKETAKTVQRKSKKVLNKAKAETSGQRSTNQAPNTPAPTDR